MSINSLLGTARLSLMAQQAAMQTTANNIANAQTPGYTRESAELVANRSLQTAQGNIGTGVLLGTVVRNRDTVLDVNYRTQNAKSEGATTRNDLLNNISSMYGEPSDTGFASSLDQFWNAWSDLAANPTNTAAKSVVQQRGAQVANMLNQFSNQLVTQSTTIKGDIQSSVDQINTYSKQVADLNNEIVAAEAGGHTAGDLRDQRDQIIDKMSGLVPLQVIENSDSSTTVYVGGSAIVDGIRTRDLAVSNAGGKVSLTFAQSGTTLPNPGGSIGAMMDVVNTDIPDQQKQLDTLAQQLVTTVNTIHETGWSAAGDALGNANWDPSAGPTGSRVDFFDPNGVTAGTISLSVAVKKDATVIAAGNVQNGTGNTDVANQMAGLRTATTSVLKYGSTTQTTSFATYYQDQVTRLGVSQSDADQTATIYSTLAQQADTQRQSADGVSTDEELVDMTKHQQAYAAAAKVITTANEMAQALLDMVP